MPYMCILSHVLLFATIWTVACQALLSMGFVRQEYWSGLLLPTLGDPLDPEIEPASLLSPVLQADSLPAALYIDRKPYRFHKKIIRANEQILQGCKMQDYLTEISLHEQWNIRNRKFKNKSLLKSCKKKYLGINLTKEVKDSYAKDYKILIKKTKDDSKKWKDIPQGLGLEELTLLKFPYYPKQSTELIWPLSNYLWHIS